MSKDGRTFFEKKLALTADSYFGNESYAISRANEVSHQMLVFFQTSCQPVNEFKPIAGECSKSRSLARLFLFACAVLCCQVFIESRLSSSHHPVGIPAMRN